MVEGVLANVLKPFVSGDRVVQFDPRGPEDEEQAEQETDYVNFVALERNNGFVALASAVKDCLLQRAGYIKCAWTKRDDVLSETYQGLSDDELAALMQDKDVEVVQHSEGPAYTLQTMTGEVPPMLHDVKVRRNQPTEFVEIMPTPPEEVLISARVRVPSLQDSDFVQHRTPKMLSELRQAGYDIPDDIEVSGEDGETVEEMSRQRFSSRSDLYDDETQDPSRRIVLYKETWLRIDRDGDGIAELRRVCTVGSTILADDEADIIPIAAFCPTLMPHQHLGISLYDQIKDLAEIKTAMLRAYLDNKYLANNPRTYANMDAEVNLDDLMVSRPGGVIRGRGPANNAIQPIVIPDTGASAMEALQYLDVVREGRTGYTKAAEGMKSGSLATNTLGEYQQQISQSTMRLEMMSRTIAETGVRDLFRIVHALTLKHSTREEKVRLRNKWVLVNPREWVRRTDLSISVGLGSASQHQMVQNLMMLGTAQEKVMALGLASPRNVYNLLDKLTNSMGYKNTEAYFTPPKQKPVVDPQTGQPKQGPDGKPEMEDAPPPTPKPPEVQAAEIKAQVEMQLAQGERQADVQRFQAEQQGKAQELQMQAAADRERAQNELQVQAANDQRQAMLDERQAQFEMVKLQKEYEFKYWLAEQELQMKAKLETYKADRAAETAREVAKNKPKPEARA